MARTAELTAKTINRGDESLNSIARSLNIKRRIEELESRDRTVELGAKTINSREARTVELEVRTFKKE